MRSGLTSYLDKGASLGPDAPCLTLDGTSLSYREVVDLSHAVARALRRSGVRPGDKVGILSGNDPTAFSCVFGIARAGAVWCPINPRNGASENRELLDLFDCAALIFQPALRRAGRRDRAGPPVTAHARPARPRGRRGGRLRGVAGRAHGTTRRPRRHRRTRSSRWSARAARRGGRRA